MGWIIFRFYFFLCLLFDDFSLGKWSCLHFVSTSIVSHCSALSWKKATEELFCWAREDISLGYSLLPLKTENRRGGQSNYPLLEDLGIQMRAFSLLHILQGNENANAENFKVVVIEYLGMGFNLGWDWFGYVGKEYFNWFGYILLEI